MFCENFHLLSQICNHGGDLPNLVLYFMEPIKKNKCSLSIILLYTECKSFPFLHWVPGNQSSVEDPVQSMGMYFAEFQSFVHHALAHVGF